MGMKIATRNPCFHWSQPKLIPHLPPSSQTLISLTKRYRCVQRSALFGTRFYSLNRIPCLDNNLKPGRRTCSASLDGFSDDEFRKEIQELALRFQLSSEEDGSDNNASNTSDGSEFVDDDGGFDEKPLNLVEKKLEFDLDFMEPSPDIIIPASIERKANSVDLPVSLRIIKRKLKWQDGLRETGESAYCSVKKAFSSMVFIIRELHSYSLCMRKRIFAEDLQGILVRVQKEMHASFVWLFQQVFSHTPTLMVYVMILLANFTVYSMGNNTAVAAPPPSGSYAPVTESVSSVEIQDQRVQKFDSSSIKTFKISPSSSSGKSTLIGGNNGGGGGKVRPVASGTDGDGWQEMSDQFGTVVPDGASKLSSVGSTAEAESVSGQITREEESCIWDSIVEEASRMQALLRDKSLDHETIKSLVSPITAEIEADDFTDYLKTELLYQTGLKQEPNNPLLLANYAQFLYLVAHDNDRAEEYFKKATGWKGADADAEAYSKYANFLWRAKKNMWAAEETYLEAISIDPTNSYYASSYAHFLWNTGGDDTCFPLSSPDT